jgi:FtsP/CotA-like multicopper oxidase with cupredoxin domain
MVTRRNFLKSSAALSALAAMPLSLRWSIAQAITQRAGLSDPRVQFDAIGFANPVPDALDPTFIYTPDTAGNFKVQIREGVHYTGLLATDGVTPVPTNIFGYVDRNAGKKALPTWPGKTFQVTSAKAGGKPTTQVKWQNRLEQKQHLFPVDTNLHWCYSLPGYTGNTIAANGVPTITHLHGGHSDFQYDGNPEFFSNPYEDVIGPQWKKIRKGFTDKFIYDNNVNAGNLWYHDHALGITRLNVYAGLAGFYFVRDALDTGLPDNAYTLPAWPYEKAYAIQDRMFKDTGDLFFSAYPGDPFYDDFITGEEAVLPDILFPGGGPTALAEFFGDHMLVNGVAWPKEDVEPRPYRLRLLNGTDSRFMKVQFRAVDPGVTDPAQGDEVRFTVVGSDQGIANAATEVNGLIFEPGSRYDIVVDFSALNGKRVIMTNALGDAPFGGDLPDLDPEVGDVFADRRTDRIMAFDVGVALGATTDALGNPVGYAPIAFNPAAIAANSPWLGVATSVANTRQVALFEGKDEFGRLQPLLGTAVPSTVLGMNGSPLNGAIAWHEATTENPALGATEEWEIWNGTGDAHPVHLHLVNFEILDRSEIKWDSNADEDGRIPDGSSPAGDGTYKVMQPTMQHNSEMGNFATYGMGFRFENLTLGDPVVLTTEEGYVENAPKDMVTALPGTVTRIKATFDKPGRYVWHCHILSHEDHEMMRVLHVGKGA